MRPECEGDRTRQFVDCLRGDARRDSKTRDDDDNLWRVPPLGHRPGIGLRGSQSLGADARDRPARGHFNQLRIGLELTAPCGRRNLHLLARAALAIDDRAGLLATAAGRLLLQPASFGSLLPMILLLRFRLGVLTWPPGWTRRAVTFDGNFD